MQTSRKGAHGSRLDLGQMFVPERGFRQCEAELFQTGFVEGGERNPVAIDVVALQFAERVQVGIERLRNGQIANAVEVHVIAMAIDELHVPGAKQHFLAKRNRLPILGDKSLVDFAGLVPFAFTFEGLDLLAQLVAVAGIGCPKLGRYKQGSANQNGAETDCGSHRRQFPPLSRMAEFMGEVVRRTYRLYPNRAISVK